MKDNLSWWEKLPLALATTAQSVVVGLWYYRSIELGAWQLNLLVAVVAGLALDAIVVTTVMGRRVGRESGWSMGAAAGAFLCSALIAIDTYSAWLVFFRPLLHISYPLMVFLYSQHLATPRKTALAALPERSRLTEQADLPNDAPSLNQAPIQAIADEALEDEITPLTLVESPRYTCPHCSEALATKQAVGAAVKNGYCLNCKAARKAA